MYLKTHRPPSWHLLFPSSGLAYLHVIQPIKWVCCSATRCEEKRSLAVLSYSELSFGLTERYPHLTCFLLLTILLSSSHYLTAVLIRSCLAVHPLPLFISYPSSVFAPTFTRLFDLQPSLHIVMSDLSPLWETSDDSDPGVTDHGCVHFFITRLDCSQSHAALLGCCQSRV